MKKRIVLELHKQDNAYILESQDVFQYIGETDKQEIDLAFYIDKWCQYLNYYIFHSKEMMFGDAEYTRLEGWIDGYNHAKSIQVDYCNDRIEISMRKYHIVLKKPYKNVNANQSIHEPNVDPNKCCLFCHSSMSGTGLDGTDILVCFNCAGKENLEMEVYEDDYCENFN